MTPAQLSRKLKASELPETLTIRIHRAISWIKSAEKQDGNLDMKFISLWIALILAMRWIYMELALNLKGQN